MARWKLILLLSFFILVFLLALFYGKGSQSTLISQPITQPHPPQQTHHDNDPPSNTHRSDNNHSISSSTPNTIPPSLITFKVDTSRGGTHPLSHPKKREQLWADPYSNESHKEEMLIRRLAYIDDRFEEPFIVLIAMQNEKIPKHNYFAKITYTSNFGGKTEEQCLSLEYWIKSGNLNLKHNLPEIYVNYILRTKGSLLKGKIPHHLTVRRDCKEGRGTDDIIIWNNKNAKQSVKYGVCLHKGLFNIKDSQRLVDWIEIHKALGVESITVYLEDVPETIASAIQPYVEEGLVNLLDWKLGKRTRDYGQSGVMTECHYINMYSVQYLGTYDLDEVIVPVKHSQWKGMFEELSKNDPKFENYASFLFHGLPWHDGRKNETINGSQTCTKVKLPFYFRKTIRDDHAHDHPKVIIRPLLTLLVQVHDIGRCVSGKIKAMVIDEKIASCHHYRVPDGEGRNVLYDGIMSRYKDMVFNGIRNTLCK